MQSAFVQQIDLKKTIILGIKPFTDRRDRLVFCVERKEHLIITYDAGLNEIVKARSVTDEDGISENKKRRTVWLQSPELHDAIYHPAPRGIVVKFFGQFWSEEGEVKVKILGTHRIENAPQMSEDILNNETLMQKLYRRALAHGVQWEDLLALIVSERDGRFLMRVEMIN